MSRISDASVTNILSLLTGGLYGLIRGAVTGEDANQDKNRKKQAEAMYNALYDVDPAAAEQFKTENADIFSDDYGYNKEGKIFNSIMNKYTGAGLTPAEQETNDIQWQMMEDQQQFDAEEAEKARQWQMYVEQNKYRWNTQSMKAAGLNPAMVYGGGNLVGTQATGAQASASLGHPVSPGSSSLGDLIGGLMAMVRMPLEMKRLAAESRKADKEGDAALMNAETNKKNAETNKYNADTSRMEMEIHRKMAESNIEVNDAQVVKIAQETSNLVKTWEQMGAYLDIAYKNAESNEKNAIAALQSSRAALMNARVNEKLSDYEVACKEAKAALDWANSVGQEVINKFLPEEQRAKIRELQARGYYWNQEGNLVDKQGHLVDAQTVETYVRAGKEVSDAINSWVYPTFTK